MQTIRKSFALGKNPIREVACGFVLFLTLSWVYAAQPQEPAYGGRSLTAWLALAEERDYPAAAFSNAVTAMGPKIVPWLIEVLDPPATTNQIHAAGAIAACRVLGTNALPAIPALAKRLAQGYSQAASTLAALGPEAVPVLADTLVTMPPQCAPQFYAAQALASFGLQGRGGVTNLALMVEQSKISWVRTSSTRALGTIAGELAAKEPRCAEVLHTKAVLMKGLAAPEEWLQSATVDAVGNFKTHGSDFAPKLQRLLIEKQQRADTETIRKKIEKALELIDPKGVFRTATTT